MIRDTRRDEAYFDKWIDFRQTTINEDIGKTYPRLEGQAGLVYDLFSYSLKICIMSYSRGDSLSAMKGSVWQALEMREKKNTTLKAISGEAPDIANVYHRLTPDNYSEGLILLCFVLAVGGTEEDIQRTLSAFDYAGQDILLDKVAILLGDTSREKNKAESLLLSRMYQKLWNVIEGTEEQRPALMKKYIEGWYKSMKPAGWYNNDEGGEGAYFGYWCFEAALIVRLLKIDDSSFRDNVYYPKDMV